MTESYSPEELLAELVSYRSTSYNEMELAEWIHSYLSEHGLDPEIDIFNPGEFISDYSGGETANVYLDIGEGERALIIYSHIDVVDANEEMFDPEISGDIIRGRGTADMKTALAAQIYLATEFDFPGRVIFHFIADEETSGTGARRAIQDLRERDVEACDALLMEPTDNFSFLEREARGYAFIRIEGEFREIWEIAGHINEFEPGGEDSNLGNNQVIPTRIVPEETPYGQCQSVNGEETHAARPESGINSLSELLNSQKSVRLAWNPENSRNTIPAVTNYVEGEVSETNATLFVDVRTLPGDHERVISQVREIAGDLELHIDDSGPAYSTSTDSRLAEACLEAVPGAEPEASSGASDAGYYGEIAETVVGGFGPGDRSVIHTEEESIAIDEVRRTVEILESIIQNYWC